MTLEIGLLILVMLSGIHYVVFDFFPHDNQIIRTSIAGVLIAGTFSIFIGPYAVLPAVLVIIISCLDKWSKVYENDHFVSGACGFFITLTYIAMIYIFVPYRWV